MIDMATDLTADDLVKAISSFCENDCSVKTVVAKYGSKDARLKLKIVSVELSEVSDNQIIIIVE
jgi:hypothetical protein